MTIVSRPVQIGKQLVRLAEDMRDEGVRLPDRRLGEFERWHVIGAAGEAGFQGGWINYGSGTNDVSYFKDNAGVVHLAGVLRNLSPSNVDSNGYSLVCTLPAGWRPRFQEFHACNANLSAAGGPYFTSWATVLVMADGRVMAAAKNGSGQLLSHNWLIIDGHTYWTV